VDCGTRVGVLLSCVYTTQPVLQPVVSSRNLTDNLQDCSSPFCFMHVVVGDKTRILINRNIVYVVESFDADLR